MILKLLHIDVCRPMRTMSIGGVRYFLSFIDVFSRKIWVYVLKAKNMVLVRFKAWKTLAKRQSEHIVKVLRTHHGDKFVSKDINVFLHGKPCHLICRKKMRWRSKLIEPSWRWHSLIIQALYLNHEFWIEAMCIHAQPMFN